MVNTDNIGTGAWNQNSINRRGNSGVGSIAKVVAAAALLIGGVFASDRLTRTPIDYHGIPYLGYHFEKSEGEYSPVFGVEMQGWQPGSIAFPRRQEEVSFRNDDKNFNCDDAFHRSGAHASDSGLYDLRGYHSWFSGNVATKISSTNVKSQ
jgi:hypothetical protein